MRPPFFDSAACRQVADPELFFPLGEGPAHQRQIREAKAICYGCSAYWACREYTVEHPERTEFGIWAGTTERERRKSRQQVNA